MFLFKTVVNCNNDDDDDDNDDENGFVMIMMMMLLLLLPLMIMMMTMMRVLMMIMTTQESDDEEEDDNSDQMIMSACEAFSADHSVDKSARDRVDAKGLYWRLRFPPDRVLMSYFAIYCYLSLKWT